MSSQYGAHAVEVPTAEKQEDADCKALGGFLKEWSLGGTEKEDEVLFSLALGTEAFDVSGKDYRRRFLVERPSSFCRAESGNGYSVFLFRPGALRITFEETEYWVESADVADRGSSMEPAVVRVTVGEGRFGRRRARQWLERCE